jgi:hypothetical protein
MKAFLVVGLALCGVVAAQAAGPMAFDTDRLGYTGTVQKYASLDDINQGGNPIETIQIGQRDAAFRVFLGQSGVSDRFGFTGSWYYTTEENTNGFPKDHPDGNRLYSGYGNTTGNSGVGFTQLYDYGLDSVDAMSYGFSNFDGTYYQDFDLNVQGSGADYANSYARMWSMSSWTGWGVDEVIFHDYELDVTVSGLEGTEIIPGFIEATNHPTSVNGTFTAVFENVNTVTPAYNGFYTMTLNFSMDNWAFAQGDAALNGDFGDSYFAVGAIPEPAAGLMGLIGLCSVAFGRRR